MDLVTTAARAAKKVPSWVWLAAAAGVVAYVIKKGGIAAAVQDVTAGAVNVVGSAAGGVVLGAGDVIGVPRTSETKCQKAMREGNNWDASFYCDAATFLKWQGRGIGKTFEDIFG